MQIAPNIKVNVQKNGIKANFFLVQSGDGRQVGGGDLNVVI